MQPICRGAILPYLNPNFLAARGKDIIIVDSLGPLSCDEETTPLFTVAGKKRFA